MAATITWLTRAEAARKLGIDPATLWRWHRRGYGPPFYNIGGWTRYSEADLDDWIREQRKAGS